MSVYVFALSVSTAEVLSALRKLQLRDGASSVTGAAAARDPQTLFIPQLDVSAHISLFPQPCARGSHFPRAVPLSLTSFYFEDSTHK